jgi:hypothetical protein
MPGNLFMLYAISIMFIPFRALQSASEIPMHMRLLPKDRYGQFASAGSMMRSGALIFGSMGAGLFMSALASYGGMDEWRYRYAPVWTVFFQIFALVFLVLMFKEWKKLGGDEAYVPPKA